MLRFENISAGAAAFLLLSAASSHAQGRPLVIKGATLLTMTQGTIEGGTVVIQNGKIAAAGKSVEAPSEAEVIDARGEYVLPGLIDPHSHLGVYSLPELQANADGNEMTGDIEAQVRSEDAINTDDPEIARAVSGGVTTVRSLVPGTFW